MKRKTGFSDKIFDEFNIELADNFARKNKKRSKKYIDKHDLNHSQENYQLLESFKDGSYKTSKYHLYTIYETKERLIYRLPYYPDRIAHHAIMNVMEEFWNKQFIRTTYSCITGRGIHKCLKDVSKTLKRYPEETKYYLKLDIKKFYPNIDHEILKNDIIRKKIKDKKLLVILDEIIDSVKSVGDTKGVPIGNYLSQFFANLYLTYFDIWCKQELKCKWYFRYADDIVIFSSDKEYLHKVLICIKLYLRHVLKLEVKSNYRICPVEPRGVDFVGYVIHHNKVLIRKSIKKKIYKLYNNYMKGNISYEDFYKRWPAYYGWLKYSTDKHIYNYILTNLNYRK